MLLYYEEQLMNEGSGFILYLLVLLRYRKHTAVGRGRNTYILKLQLFLCTLPDKFYDPP